MVEDKAAEAAQGFRDSLKDMAAYARRMRDNCHCRTVDELIGMTELGLENDAQLALLMERVTAPAEKKR